MRIGSQADKDFLGAVVKEMGGIDVVLDDGSHQMLHIIKSLSYLFPHLNDGGIYIPLFMSLLAVATDQRKAFLH